MANKKGGRPSLEDRTGEPTRTIKILLTESQIEYASRQRGGIAAFIRYLIDTARIFRDEHPEVYELDEVRAVIGEAEIAHDKSESEIDEKADNKQENR